MIRIAAAAAILVIPAWPPVAAAQATDRIRVTVELVRSCTLAIADVDLGRSTADTPLPPNAAPVHVECPDRVPYVVSFSGGGRVPDALYAYGGNGTFELAPGDLPPGDDLDGPLLISIHL